MTRHEITDEQYERAMEAGRRAAASEFRAESVHYIADRDALEIMTTRDRGFIVPRGLIKELEDVPPEALAHLEAWPDGSAIAIDDLGIHVSVHGLLTTLLPTLVPAQAIASLFARRGGESTSAAKRASARANGRKGGRPRKAAEAV